jgi:hypothetical protein
VELSNAEVQSIFDRFDASGDGRLDYREFLDLLGFQKAVDGGKDNQKLVENNLPVAGNISMGIHTKLLIFFHAKILQRKWIYQVKELENQCSVDI